MAQSRKYGFQRRQGPWGRCTGSVNEGRVLASLCKLVCLEQAVRVSQIGLELGSVAPSWH